MHKSTSKKDSIKRYHPYNYSVIRQRNIELGQQFNHSRQKHKLTYSKLAEQFTEYLEKLYIASDIPEDIQYDWESMFKKFFTGGLTTIDYGTACLLIDFFQKLDSASSPLKNK